MKDIRFSALLAASRPDKHPLDRQFTDTVMASIQSPDILLLAVRRMDVTKKETFMSRIKRLPALAIIAIIIGSVALLSGSAYAAYQLLWATPEVHVSAPTTSASGRNVVSIDFKKCGDTAMASRYELKKNATITTDQIAGVVQAQCELNVISSWAMSEYPSSKLTRENNKEHDSTRVNTSSVTHMSSRTPQAITFAGLPKYNGVDKTLAISAKTIYIADGHQVTADQVSLSDPVLYITSVASHFVPNEGCTSERCSGAYIPVTETLQAVVKLSLPFENYDQFAWQSLTELATCQGNPNDTCLTGFAGAIDLYQGSGYADQSAQMKEIQGVVTALNGTSMTIKSSSGSLFTITTPTDIVAAYNTNKAAQYYNNQTVQVGSGIGVRYMERTDQHNKSISGKGIVSVQLQIEIVGKSDPVTAY